MKILIDTDWFSAIQDLQPSKQKEVLMAILNYPNGDSDTNLWKKTILPNLEKGKISYFNKLQNLKQNNPQKSNKKITESESESVIGSVSESTTDTTIREDKSREDIDKKKNRFNEDSIIYVNGQYFDEFPPESIPTLKKHWSASELEEIRKDLAFKPDHTTTVAQMLFTYPPKPKATRFVKPTVEEIEAYCKERNNGINAQYFFDSYEGKGWLIGKTPMKDWKAAIRTWEKNNFNRPQQPQKKNWSNYVGEGSFLKDPKDDPFYAEIFNKKD